MFYTNNSKMCKTSSTTLESQTDESIKINLLMILRL